MMEATVDSGLEINLQRAAWPLSMSRDGLIDGDAEDVLESPSLYILAMILTP